jgi:shikimate kinase
MRIYLIGFMASGKSTLGKELAEQLGCEFIDMDEEIEKEENLSISKIFEIKGEKFFREKETDFLKQLVQRNNIIIATGGGTPCFNDNMEQIKHSGISVYLKLKPEEIVLRLNKEETSKRPLMAKLNENEKLEYVKTKLNEREPHYNNADIVVDAAEINAGKLKAVIIGYTR